VVDSRLRLRLCLAVFVALLIVVFGRAVQLELRDGAAFRAEAAEPIVQQKRLRGLRGRILARDGTVLATDRQMAVLTVHYRALDQTPDPELVQWAGVSREQWQRRAERIRARVRRITESVNRRRLAEFQQQFDDSTDRSPPEPITVAETLQHHVMAEAISAEAVAQFQAHPDRYPDARLEHRWHRVYPAGATATHVLGYLGAGEQTEDRVGRAGVERRYESVLRGRNGRQIDRIDHGGQLLSSEREIEPRPGADLVLTIDTQLQQAAENLLDAALDPRAIDRPDDALPPAGGAIVVMDVQTGAIRAIASAPRFDPNLFAGRQPEELQGLLTDPAHPLFDRATQMAIPAGSVFKIVTAAAMLETDPTTAEESLFCQGYLYQKNAWRCAVFRHQGVGHDRVTLTDALAQSCNVFFFHHAGRLGPEPLIGWAERFGFGRPTGIDLPGESAGSLPTPENIEAMTGRRWQLGDTLGLAVGQSALRATPLQVVRMTAAIANGGRLVTPHVVDQREPSPSTAIDGLSAGTLAAIRTGMERAVADDRGTAHRLMYDGASLGVAAKTGTAQAHPDRPDHAWLTAYFPANDPQWALVVVLEHGGNAETTAVPVARRLILQMRRLGYSAVKATRARPHSRHNADTFPPGHGDRRET